MPDTTSPFVAHVVGPPEFERFVIKRNYFQPPDYSTGALDDPWSLDLGEARLYADLGELGRDLHELARRELAHMPQVAYRLEIEVLAIGEATPEQVGELLRDALRVGLDHEVHGSGPGPCSVILAKADTGSLRPEDSPREAPKTI
jgi:hypothetical protein